MESPFDALPTIAERDLPLDLRKHRYPLWVRFGLIGVRERPVMVAHLWAMAVLTVLSAATCAIALHTPEALPWGLRDPSWTGTMVAIGCVGLAHLRAVLRWLDQRRAW